MPTISGIVKDASGTPCAALVRAYNRNTGALAGEVVSNPTTGAYSISVLSSDPHVVVRISATASTGDPNWGSCVLAMHMSGANNSQDFIDEKGRAISVAGNTKISSAVGLYDGVSGYFDGNGDYLYAAPSSDFSPGTGPFTIRSKLYVTGGGGGYSDFASTLIDLRDAGYGAGVGFILALTTSNKVRIFGILESSAALPYNQWVDLEINRSGGEMRILIGGSLDAYTSNSTNINHGYLTIGAPIDGRASNSYMKYQGYMKDLQMYNGVAVNPSAFTPPAQLFVGATLIGLPTENAQIFDYVTPM